VTPDEIAHALANISPWDEDADCFLCVNGTNNGGLESHDATCPWRAAVEYISANSHNLHPITLTLPAPPEGTSYRVVFVPWDDTGTRKGTQL
jgi:hypothetical protein